ncbi:MAG: MIP/aquaporin family protein [Opitutales bacterium]
MNNLLRASLCEVLGTFFLVFVGGAAIINQGFLGAGFGLIGVALAHGLALAIAVTATMNISGGQINPAISIGLALIKQQSWQEAGAFIVSQLVGAALAGLLLFIAFPIEGGALVEAGASQASALAAATPQLRPGLSAVSAIAIETVATFLLVAAIWGTAVSKSAPPGIAGFGIGLTVTFLILAVGPQTGAAMNPARHLGTAIFGGAEVLAQTWIYWVGPLLGAILGFLAVPHFIAPKIEKGPAPEAPPPPR